MDALAREAAKESAATDPLSLHRKYLDLSSQRRTPHIHSRALKLGTIQRFHGRDDDLNGGMCI